MHVGDEISVFRNHAFYFIETCDLYNYANDNTLDIITSTIDIVLNVWEKILIMVF